MPVKSLLKDAISMRKTKLATEVSKKFSLGGQVKTWVDDVTAEDSRLPSTGSVTTTVAFPPPSTLVSSSGKSSARTSVASHVNSALPIPAKVLHTRQAPLSDPLEEIFSDAVSDGAERWAVAMHNIAKGTTKLIAVTPSNDDEDDDEVMPFPSTQPRKAPWTAPPSQPRAPWTEDDTMFPPSQPRAPWTKYDRMPPPSQPRTPWTEDDQEMPPPSQPRAPWTADDQEIPPPSQPPWTKDDDGMPPPSQPQVTLFTLKHKLSCTEIVSDSEPESIEGDRDICWPAVKGHRTTGSVSQNSYI
ncbi:hypothetical protein JVT61DRAFT_8383 [Boletus reticuloceps]|uniref:Uncharacterized protein n=1 Tax=Boletus reticuloceps TaxID=495285 RepID=A0A8I2YYG7_9AGAM|nr:hypothetical protein JVT61DRAFT_8383 [Boletus reticuloceps]